MQSNFYPVKPYDISGAFAVLSRLSHDRDPLLHVFVKEALLNFFTQEYITNKRYINAQGFAVSL